ncbi:MAG: T9SS type A sorting domain-containing protein [Crocinitomicaceae bacterium]|nr:T9SS type A sorting domain-containing protein [Crocinitomicaceae bacterium]
MFSIKRFLFLIILTIPLFGASQQVGLKWAHSFGSESYDRSHQICTDFDNNIYITGAAHDTVDFDPGPGTAFVNGSGTFMFVVKFNSSGDFIWVKSMMGTANDVEGMDIVTDGAHLYVTGRYNGFSPVDFDPGAGVYQLTSNGGYDIFVLKLDLSGNFEWAKGMGGTTTYIEEGSSLAVNANGEVLITGGYVGTVDFDPGPGIYNLTSVAVGDVFLLKLDSLGDFVWAKEFGSTWANRGTSVKTGKFGAIYLAGHFSYTVDFDPGPGTYNLTSNGGFDGFVLKLSENGGFCWANQIGGLGTERASRIDLDSAANIYVGGYFTDTVDFDPGIGTHLETPNGSADAYVLKLDTSGNFLWVNTLGGVYSDALTNIHVGKDENIYSVGDFRDTVDFDPSGSSYYLTCPNSACGFLQITDSTGNLINAFNMGRSSETWDVQTDSIGGTYVMGLFKDTIDLNPNSAVNEFTSNGNYDIYIEKFGECLHSTSSLNLSVLDSLSWIDGNTYYSDVSGVEHIIQNAQGCDSTITLNLTVDYAGFQELLMADIELYPNPADKSLSMRFSRVGTYELYILSIEGRILHQEEVSNTDSYYLNLAAFNQGEYYIVIKNDTILLREKFLIVR